MQKLNQIQNYVRVADGTAVTFAHPEGQAMEARLIKMRLNVPQAVRLYLTRLDHADEATGEVIDDVDRFLAYVDAGYDQLEYYYCGNFALRAVGGDIWLDTLDSSNFELLGADDANYARVWEREEQDPRILEMQALARYNQRQLEEQMARDRAEYQARMDEMLKRMEAKNVATPAPDANRGTASPVAPVPSGATGDDKGKQAAPAAGNGGEPDA